VDTGHPQPATRRRFRPQAGEGGPLSQRDPGRLQMRNVHIRIALDNMSQGLCMFDGSERLVV
jgi:hypothetical protein